MSLRFTKEYKKYTTEAQKDGITETYLIQTQKVREALFFVIPAKAGIQLFQRVIKPLDTGFHR